LIISKDICVTQVDTHTHTHKHTRTHKRTSPVYFANAFFLTNYETLSSIRRYVAILLCFKFLRFILKGSCFPCMHSRHEALDRRPLFIYVNQICQTSFKNMSKICNLNCGHLTKLESGIFRPVSGF